MGPKKTKQTMSLGTFLGDQSLGSWADEMEDMPMPSTDQKSYSRGSFQAGPRPERDERGFHRQERPELPLPNAPPYTAHLGNLSFDVTNGDVEDFFAGCEVTNVRIVEDKLDRKPKGFGYVEFNSLEGLKEALTKNGSSFQNRAVRISVADPPKDRPDQRSFDDWSRKGPLPELSRNDRRVSTGPPGRSFDNKSDAGSDRGGFGMERGGSRRGPPAFEGDGKTRDFGNWERKGPPTPVERAPPSREGRPSRGVDRGLERKPSPAQWGEGRSQDSGSRPPPPAAPERQPSAADMDNQWRARMKPDAPPAVDKPSASPTPEPSAPTSPAAAPSSRPKLNLQKRTVSNAPSDAPTSAGDSKASPFGAARPTDTASKEQAAFEKRAAARKVKEEEDKARIEKEKTEKAARAEEKKARGESVPSTPTASGHQENGTNGKNKDQNGEKKEDKSKGAQFEILRRMQDDGEEGSEVSGARDEHAEGSIVDDKSVKPQEVVRDMGTGEQPTSSAQGLEEEGWSTITSNTKKGHRKRNSMAASRSLAS